MGYGKASDQDTLQEGNIQNKLKQGDWDLLEFSPWQSDQS
jgi:hypothetical protein